MLDRKIWQFQKPTLYPDFQLAGGCVHVVEFLVLVAAWELRGKTFEALCLIMSEFMWCITFIGLKFLHAYYFSWHQTSKPTLVFKVSQNQGLTEIRFRLFRFLFLIIIQSFETQLFPIPFPDFLICTFIPEIQHIKSWNISQYQHSSKYKSHCRCRQYN